MPKNPKAHPKLIRPHGLRPGAQALEAHQHTLFRHSKMRFQTEI